jgi:hypothetical protein
MRDRYPTRRRRAVAAVVLALAMGTSAGACFAQDAASDEDNAPADTKIIRQFMKDWGFRRDGEEVGIDYRERPPLVLPPSRNLPPPQSEATGSIKNPAWPSDPDVNRRKQAAAAEKAKLKGVAISVEEQSRPLRPDELNGRRGSGDGVEPTSSKGPAVTVEDSQRALRPEELGAKNPFASLFSGVGSQKTETAPFTGEKARTSMTEPPTGYQTPSPAQPYGLGPAKTQYTVPKPEDHAVGSAQQ